jgi:hypothetical protein
MKNTNTTRYTFISAFYPLIRPHFTLLYPSVFYPLIHPSVRLLSIRLKKYFHCLYDAQHRTHDPRRTTHDARRTTHDARRTTHPPTPFNHPRYTRLYKTIQDYDTIKIIHDTILHYRRLYNTTQRYATLYDTI